MTTRLESDPFVGFPGRSRHAARTCTREAFSNEKALMIMKEGRGKHFDPEFLDLFIENPDEMVAIQETVREGPGGGR